MHLTEFLKALMSLDWATLANVAVVLTAIFVIWQLREMQRTTQAQSYSVAVDRLQREEVRAARRTVFGLKDKPMADWTEEERRAAEIVCHTYDVVGQMVRHRLLQGSIILDSWGPSLRRSWPILEQLVEKYRQDWDDRKSGTTTSGLRGWR